MSHCDSRRAYAHSMVAVPSTDELSAGERALAIELALSHVQNRYVERVIRLGFETGGAAEATKTAAHQCRNWGSWSAKMRADGGPKGLQVRMPDGRRGMVSWRELAQAALPREESEPTAE